MPNRSYVATEESPLYCIWPRQTVVFPVPISFQNWVHMRIPVPLSAGEFDYMIYVLGVMRPGLVSEEKQAK